MVNQKSDLLIGVISDTHGIIHPAVLKIFKHSDLIVHAGDVGKPQVLDDLCSIAPVAAVQGNMDRDGWAVDLPVTKVVEAGGVVVYTLHDLTQLDLDPAAAGFNAVISGHTHHASIHHTRGVLYLNPGSAGPGGRSHPPSVALLYVRSKEFTAEIIELED